MSFVQSELYTWDIPLEENDIAFMKRHTENEIDNYMSLRLKQKENNFLHLVITLGKHGKSNILNLLNVVPFVINDSKLPTPFNCFRYKLECKNPSDNFFITNVNIYYSIPQYKIISTSVKRKDLILQPKSKIKK